MHTSPRPTIALVGAGPRGTSIIERLGAHLANGDPSSLDFVFPIDLHIIDEAPWGTGRIWRTDQPRDLCMNTLAHAVTLFTEHSSTVAGPIVEGPTLYEWCLLARGDSGEDIPVSHRATFEACAPNGRIADEYRDELATLVPESHPSRALYGEYLAWAYDRALATLPEHVRVIHHHTRAVSITAVSDSERELVRLADGGQITADTVILATGWMPRMPTPEEASLEAALERRPDLTWVRQGSPIEQDLSGVTPNSNVVIRGLGMGFFDTVSLLTIGRGGSFVEDPTRDSGLRYIASGREPQLYATSHRGVPFRAKSLYRALPPSPKQRFLRAISWPEQPRPIDFNEAFWPRVVADAFTDHVQTLARVQPGVLAAPVDDIVHEISVTLEQLLGSEQESLEDAVRAMSEAVGQYIPNPEYRFDLLTEMRLTEMHFDSAAAYNEWVIRRVHEDLREAYLGHDSALKAGLWSISAARGISNSTGSLGGFDAESRRTGFRTLSALGGMVGSGPPAFRNEQLLALIEAGIISFIGPRPQITVTDKGFTAHSPNVHGSHVHAVALIDAWMHAHDVAQSADPLAHSLVEAGRARSFAVRTRSGAPTPTGAFEVDPETGRLITLEGAPDRGVHLAGIPADEQLHGTIISPMPGTDPPMLRETDRIARSALEIAASSPVITLSASPSTPSRLPEHVAPATVSVPVTASVGEHP